MPAHRSPIPPLPTTVAAAEALGWSRAARRHAVHIGQWDALSRGVVAPHCADRAAENLRRAQAAVLTCDRAAISHLAAAIAHELPTLGDLSRPCVTVPAGTALRRLAGAHLHRATITADDVSLIDDFRVLAPARTVLDIAREFGVASGVVAADGALRKEVGHP